MSQRVKLHNTAIILSIILLLHSCNSVDEFSGGKTSGESPILLSAEPAKDYSRSYIPSGMTNAIVIGVPSVDFSKREKNKD